MIEPQDSWPSQGHVRKPTEYERLVKQLEFGVVRIGPEAARKIARRIERQGGFWGPRVDVEEYSV